MPALIQGIQGSTKTLPWSGDTNQRRRTRRYLLNEVEEGLLVTVPTTPGANLDMTAGSAYINGTLVTVAAITDQATGLGAPTLNRMDTVALQKNGVVVCAAGTEGATAADAVNATSAAVASDLPTAITLALDIRTVFNAHIQNGGAGTSPYHKQTSPHVITAAITTASVLADVLVFANLLKTAFNDHLEDFNVHGVGPTVAGTLIVAPDATDQATLETLLNEIRTDWATHIADTGQHNACVITAVTDPDSIVLAVVSQLAGAATITNDKIWNGGRPRLGLV